MSKIISKSQIYKFGTLLYREFYLYLKNFHSFGLMKPQKVHILATYIDK